MRSRQGEEIDLPKENVPSTGAGQSNMRESTETGEDATTTTDDVFGFIYRVTCLPTGQSYIGQTTQEVSHRWAHHVSSALHGAHGPLSEAIRSFGGAAFSVTTVCSCTSFDDLDRTEKMFIEEEKTTTPSGLNGPTNGSASNKPRIPFYLRSAKRVAMLNTWRGMINRCYKQETSGRAWRNYGGRGIKVCERWRFSFENFFEDMEATWEPGLTIDRIDNDGDYEPDNCRWATRLEQANNSSRAKPVTVGGKSFRSIHECLRSLEISKSPLVTRRKKGLSDEEALALPVSEPSKRTVVKGMEFKSLTAACSFFGVSDGLYKARLKLGWDQDRAISTPPQPHDVWVSHNIPITVRGKSYPSLSKCAEAHSISDRVLWYRVQVRALPTELAVFPHRLWGEPIQVEGKWYSSIKEALRAYGLGYSSFKRRVRKGMSKEDAIRIPPIPHDQIQSKRCIAITVRGQSFTSISAAARAFGISHQEASRRLKGIDKEDHEAVDACFDIKRGGDESPSLLRERIARLPNCGRKR